MTVPSRFAISTTKKGNPAIHTLKVNEIERVDKNKIRKVAINYDGYRSISEYGSKVIMLVGETGSGKTLMMNALLNYVLGVKWGDSYRYKLDPDEHEIKKSSHTRSQTEWISVYTLHHHECYRIPYSIKIIDTPGFGDTAGTSKDQQTTQQMKLLFNRNNVEEGIDHLHAVIFVAQSDKVRLTVSQKYVFDCILSLFGENVKDNMFLFTTFADQNVPLVLEAMKQAGIYYKSYYKFNNSSLYVKKDSANASAEGSSDEEREAFNEMFWKSGAREFKKFFKVLGLTSSRSTWLSYEVLREREALNIRLQAIPQLIRTKSITLKYLSKVEEMLKRSQDEVTRHSEYTHIVNVEVTSKIELPDGEYAMTCRKCKVNCHYPCSPYFKRFCSAFYWYSGCSVCPNHCSKLDHDNTNIFYEKKMIAETQTYAEVKSKYDSACKESLSHKELVYKVSANAKKEREELSKHVHIMRETLDRLGEIALKKNPLTASDYLKYLMRAEEAKMELGWEDCVDELKILLTECSLW